MTNRKLLPALLVGLSLLITGGSGQEPAPGTSQGTDDASQASPQPQDSDSDKEQTPTLKEQVESIFSSQADPTVLAEATGTVLDSSSQGSPARVKVTLVNANAHSTRVRFELLSLLTEEVSVDYRAFNEFTPLAPGIRDVALEDPSSGTRLFPLIGVSPAGTDDSRTSCVCSDSPKTIDAQGVTLDATFAPLAPGTSTVTVAIPGFAPIEAVPVSWDRG